MLAVTSDRDLCWQFEPSTKFVLLQSFQLHSSVALLQAATSRSTWHSMALTRRLRKPLLKSCVVLGILALIFIFIAKNSSGSEWQIRVISSSSRQHKEFYAWMQSKAAQHQTICDNTCLKARDSVCDEARGGTTSQTQGNSVEVLCDLGTDCQDCQPWTSLGGSAGSLPWLTDKPGPEPVQWLRARNESIRIMHTSTQPSFLMPITDASRDPDVSAMLHGYRHMTGGLTRAIHSMLSGACINASLAGGRGMVAVVGANMGYTALYAAVMGCRVIAWEPVPLLRAYLAHGMALNNVSHLVQVRPYAVSDLPPGSEVTLGVAKWGTYWGLASVNNLNLHAHEVRDTVRAVTERLDDVIPPNQPVLLLKVDVEGYEPEVMASAHRLIASRQARHVQLEYSPGIADRHKDWDRLLRLSLMLKALLDAGYSIGHMPVFAVAAPWPPKDMSEWYGKPFPVLDEVGQQEVAADIQAAQFKLRTESNGSCEMPPALSRFAVWKSCGEWTRTVHPKGFRSSHGYNTNIWASLSSAHTTADARGAGSKVEGVLHLHGNAALFSRDEQLFGPAATLWSTARPGTGLGGVACDTVGKGHRLIHRCPCPDAKLCGEEETALATLIKQGGLFFPS